MKIKNYFLSLLFVACGPFSWSQTVVVDTVSEFKPIEKLVKSKLKEYEPEEMLVVLDIDNTILTNDALLGSDFWYQWQSGKLPVKPKDDQKLSSDCMFNEAITLLFQVGTMSVTDQELPKILAKWQDEGISVMALTSRGPVNRQPTERELLRNGIDLTRAQPRNAEGNSITFANMEKGRDASYANGIFMTSGMDKGVMLDYLLGRLGKTYRAIVFVDDTWKNDANMQAEFSSGHAVDMTIFYFPRIEEIRRMQNNGKILTQQQADQMDADWQRLLKELGDLFPFRQGNTPCSQ